MIALYEPLCKSHSHEVFNAGFIELYAIAFPEEELRVIAEETHINHLKNIIEQEPYSARVLFVPTRWPKSWKWFGALKGLIVMYRASRSWRKTQDQKIVFLSFDSVVLVIAKFFLGNREKKSPPILFVVHGILESVGNASGRNNNINPRGAVSTAPLSVAATLRRAFSILLENPVRFIGSLFARSSRVLVKPLDTLFQYVTPTLLTALRWRNSSQHQYILLSDHIQQYLSDSNHIRDISFQTIPLPRKMTDWSPAPHGCKVIFGVFGYGLPSALETIFKMLQDAEVYGSYEVRLIGNMPRYLSRYRNVLLMRESALLRSEMEQFNRDVNIQLILYPSDSYRLSASGSIFEALAYSKPIIHLSNPCISFYNAPNHRIGFEVDTLNDMVMKMTEIINNYQSMRGLFEEFHNNLRVVRRKYGLDSSVRRLKRFYVKEQATHPS